MEKKIKKLFLGKNIKDNLFEVCMTRFEILDPYKRSINKKKKSTDRYHLSVDFVKYFKKMDVYSKKEKCTFPYFLCCTKFGCSSKEMLDGCSKTKFPPSSNH